MCVIPGLAVIVAITWLRKMRYIVVMREVGNPKRLYQLIFASAAILALAVSEAKQLTEVARYILKHKN